MNKILKRGCLYGLAICLPVASYCKTTAYSPSIAGQPLIFHKSNSSLIDHKFFKNLSRKQTEQLFEFSRLSVRLSVALLGLVETFFLSIDPSQKQNLVILYNDEINTTISLIDHEFRSLKGHSKKLTKLIQQTLKSFTQITNQMLIDITAGLTNEFQQDYQEMQTQVINHFKMGISKILKKHDHSLAKAEAESGLEGLVSAISLCMTDLKDLIDGSDSVSKNLILVRQQVTKNLTIFVNSNFFLQITDSL